MNWLRRLFGLHVHEWGDVETLVIPGGTYISDLGTIHEFAGRILRYRWCYCGNYKHVYGGKS